MYLEIRIQCFGGRSNKKYIFLSLFFQEDKLNYLLNALKERESLQASKFRKISVIRNAIIFVISAISSFGRGYEGDHCVILAIVLVVGHRRETQ